MKICHETFASIAWKWHQKNDTKKEAQSDIRFITNHSVTSCFVTLKIVKVVASCYGMSRPYSLLYDCWILDMDSREPTVRKQWHVHWLSSVTFYILKDVRVCFRTTKVQNKVAEDSIVYEKQASRRGFQHQVQPVGQWHPCREDAGIRRRLGVRMLSIFMYVIN